MKTPINPGSTPTEAPPASAVAEIGLNPRLRTLEGRSNRQGLARWLAYFVALSIALLIIVLLMLWVTGSFEGAGLTVNGWVALFLGITLTSALGIALMGLVFYSDRQDVDDRAYHAADTEGEAASLASKASNRR